MIYLAEITAAIDAAGTTRTLRLSDRGFITQPDDAPANAYYEPRITQPASLAREMYSGGTSGRSDIAWGELVATNIDGGLDAWKSYSFDGRDCIIRLGEDSARYLSDFTTVIKGTVEQATLDWSSFRLLLRDRLSNFDKPWLTTRYAGTNSLPSGLEGVGDIKGKVKPRTLGKVLNVQPPCVNTTRLIYEVGPCASVDAVYDQGIALTAGTNYTSQSDMETTAPSAGYFRAWPGGGYFRLGSSPVGPVTADVTQGASTAARTVAQLIKQIALDMGTAAGDISSADVTALDTANSAVAGVYADSDQRAIDLMDQLAASIGAWYGFDRLGVLRMGVLTAPSGDPVVVLNAANCLPPQRQQSQDEGGGLPAYRINLTYAKNYTVQKSGLAGAVTAARRSVIEQSSASVSVEDASIKTQYLNAVEIKRDTLLSDGTATATEAARLLALYKVAREFYAVRVRDVSAAMLATLDLGSVVQMVFSRFGLADGKLFIVIGITYDFRNRAVDLRLWG